MFRLLSRSFTEIQKKGVFSRAMHYHCIMDGSYDKDCHSAGGGAGLITDICGHIFGSVQFKYTSELEEYPFNHRPVASEFLTFKDILLYLESFSSCEFIIHTDCQELIRMNTDIECLRRNRNHILSLESKNKGKGLVKLIRTCSKIDVKYTISKIDSAHNKICHLLANKARYLNLGSGEKKETSGMELWNNWEFRKKVEEERSRSIYGDFFNCSDVYFVNSYDGHKVEKGQHISEFIERGLPSNPNKLFLEASLKKAFLTTRRHIKQEEIDDQEDIDDGAYILISYFGDFLSRELLQAGEDLVKSGNHPRYIIRGFGKSLKMAFELLNELVESGSEVMDVTNKEQVVMRMKTAVSSKPYGQEDILCSLIADACIQVCPKNPTNFNVDNVRVAKLVGGGLLDSTVVRGLILKHDFVGSIKKMEKAKIAVFAGGVDFQSAEQVENYEKTQELIKAVVDSGAKVIVSGGAVGEMALQLIESYKLMVLKISSVFELQRFCRTTGTVALVSYQVSTLGYADSISVEEVSGARVTIVKNEENGSCVSTLVLRGSNYSVLDDLEAAVDCGVNTYRTMCRDSRIVPGAAATEIELARRLKDFSLKETGSVKCAIAKFAECFEKVPKILAENVRLDSKKIISSLYAAHAAGNTKVGIDLKEGVCKDVYSLNMWDLYFTKFFGIKYAAEAAINRLSTLWRKQDEKRAWDDRHKTGSKKGPTSRS